MDDYTHSTGNTEDKKNLPSIIGNKPICCYCSKACLMNCDLAYYNNVPLEEECRSLKPNLF